MEEKRINLVEFFDEFFKSFSPIPIFPQGIASINANTPPCIIVSCKVEQVDFWA